MPVAKEPNKSRRFTLFFLQIMVFPLKSPFQTYPFFIIIDEYDTPIKAGKKVIVVGGGNVAMDAYFPSASDILEKCIRMHMRVFHPVPFYA